LYAASGSVRVRDPARTIEKMKLFHEKMKLIIVAAMMPGRASGRRPDLRHHPLRQRRAAMVRAAAIAPGLILGSPSALHVRDMDAQRQRGD